MFAAGKRNGTVIHCEDGELKVGVEDISSSSGEREARRVPFVQEGTGSKKRPPEPIEEQGGTPSAKRVAQRSPRPEFPDELGTNLPPSPNLGVRPPIQGTATSATGSLGDMPEWAKNLLEAFQASNRSLAIAGQSLSSFAETNQASIMKKEEKKKATSKWLPSGV